ncbi:Cytochrome b [Apis cerana cerana]|uniref:Cytochrome b n=1 Tax=Apis cerana cerana TaxID=94128 RepID=A0A2A3E8H6_APICC|nr:Cytochrome b [Apis cerana cerana]
MPANRSGCRKETAMRQMMATPPHYPSIKNVYYIDVVIEGDNHENQLRVIGIGGCLFAWMGCDPDNFKIANPINTPTHIKSE